MHTFKSFYSDRSHVFAISLLLIACIPIKIYSIPGFEITPGLLLTPLGLLFFNWKIFAHRLVAFFLITCILIALFGMVGPEGIFRNLIGAASYSSGAPYFLVGMAIASQIKSISHLWRFLAPISVAMLLIFITDLWITSGNLLILAPYESISYSANETTFINSNFPFYGKYAVITLATVTMFIGSVSLSSLESFEDKKIRCMYLLATNGLIFFSYIMWTRQVMIGVLFFYLILLILSWRSKKAWLSAVTFSILMGLWSTGITPWIVNGAAQPTTSTTTDSDTDAPVTSDINSNAPGTNSNNGNNSDAISAKEFGAYKLNRAIENIEKGDIDDLSTGRMSIYREAIQKINARTALTGCGFCNLKDVYGFNFSSLHNIALTAIFKGGIVYMALYCGTAFLSLILLWRTPASFGRNVLIAAVASIGLQGLVNDVLFFQIIPVMLFALTGFLVKQFFYNHLQVGSESSAT